MTKTLPRDSLSAAGAVQVKHMTTSALPYGRDGCMATAAVRYCLGRSTYIVEYCCDWLREAWPTLSESTRTAIACDIEGAFAKDDTCRAEGRALLPLGMDMDRAAWERVRELWRAPG